MTTQVDAPGTHPRQSSSGYMPTLDGWRAIAVGLVCLAHTQPFTGPLAKLQRLRVYGDLGVDLFFAISGILICSRLLQEEQINGRISLVGFYIRRAFRILPAAYLFLASLAVLGFTRLVPPDWHGWWASVLLYRNYVSAAVGDTQINRLTGHFWSLAIEEHFYFILPLLLVVFPRRRKLALMLMLAASFLWLGIYIGFVPPALRQPIWIRRTDLRIWCLIFPALLAVLLQTPPFRTWLKRFLLPVALYIPFLLYFALHLAHKAYYHIPTIPPVPFDPRAPLVFDTTFDPYISLLVPLAFPFLILSTTLHPTALSSRFLEWKPMRAVGRASYGIYLWQQIYFSAHFYPDWPFGQISPALLAACTVGAILLSYFLLEKPLIRLGHRLAPPATPGHRDLDGVAKPITNPLVASGQ